MALLANPSRAPADQDCADAYIRTTQVRSSATVRALFRCLDPALQPISDEDTFVQLAATAVTSPATEVRRLGSQSTASGTVVVYTTVTNGQPVAYAVYLSRTGRIVNVE
ncbi:MAG: hypothetical protein HYX52_05795 [Chloroflexi bacterium]|nr:hypothetical protein [Chloroflexota bacterium]